ncbi:uncharacterized protein [Tenebrio molitor]|uniref:C protein n=1 Tax=Tenebrio molitor TaxID=7067 RepID=Q08596_TENMO|nr:C protein [Tenebrio molitor]
MRVVLIALIWAVASDFNFYSKVEAKPSSNSADKKNIILHFNQNGPVNVRGAPVNLESALKPLLEQFSAVMMEEITKVLQKPNGCSKHKGSRSFRLPIQKKTLSLPAADPPSGDREKGNTSEGATVEAPVAAIVEVQNGDSKQPNHEIEVLTQ